SVSTQTGVEEGTQTDVDVNHAEISGGEKPHGLSAQLVKERVAVAQSTSTKWPEVAAPQRVITSAGNAKVDGNPG
ncbi:hypothetical protein, partial [Vibrio cholerae]|uniref:hypothetical protein n=1 Tax=Vibrio cholerae TaxID=666 RepID=UPI0030806A55